jgi:hypothetical protein
VTGARIRETGRGRGKKGVPRGVLVAGLAALLFLVLVAVFVAGRSPQGGDESDIAVSRERVASFPEGESEFNASESLYIYLRHETDSELQVRYRGRVSLISVISGGGEKVGLVEEGRAGGGLRFRFEAVSGGELPPGGYTVTLRDPSGKVVGRETFSVGRW